MEHACAPGPDSIVADVFAPADSRRCKGCRLDNLYMLWSRCSFSSSSGCKWRCLCVLVAWSAIFRGVGTSPLVTIIVGFWGCFNEIKMLCLSGFTCKGGTVGNVNFYFNEIKMGFGPVNHHPAALCWWCSALPSTGTPVTSRWRWGSDLSPSRKWWSQCWCHSQQLLGGFSRRSLITRCHSFAWESRSDFLFKTADMWLTNFMLLGPAKRARQAVSICCGYCCCSGYCYSCWCWWGGPRRFGRGEIPPASEDPPSHDVDW